MNPNAEQIKSVVRWFVTTFGGMIAGWFAAKGWFTVDQVMTVLNSPVLAGAVASVAMFIWGLVVHSQTNAVAVVAAMPEVKNIVVTPALAAKSYAPEVSSTTDTKVVPK